MHGTYNCTIYADMYDQYGQNKMGQFEIMDKYGLTEKQYEKLVNNFYHIRGHKRKFNKVFIIFVSIILNIHIYPDAGLEYIYVIRNWAQNSVSFNVGQFENVTIVLLYFNLIRISGVESYVRGDLGDCEIRNKPEREQ